MKTYYEAIGSVRGSCGHKHRTQESAERCCERDQRAVSRLNGSGSLTRTYSDRRVVERRVVERARISVGMRVCSGEGEDYDTGRVDAIDGDMAIVSWDSLVVTRTPVKFLSPKQSE